MPKQPNPIYGTPDPGEPAGYLSDVVEVLRPNGDVVRLDLVALADVAISAEHAVAGLRAENEQLKRRVSDLEHRATRTEQAGRVLAGETYQGELADDLADRVRELERAARP